MSAAPALLALALAAVIGACASPVKVQYYTLAPARSGLPGGQAPALRIGPVGLPDYLIRNDIALREDANRLTYLADRRWAEPLDSGIQRVLGANLGSRLDTARVADFPGLAPPEAGFRVALTVHRFEAQGDAAVAVVEWELVDALDASALASGSFEGEVPLADRRAGTVAAGLSELLDRLAGDIADAIEELRR